MIPAVLSSSCGHWFFGQNIDFAQLTAELDNCLLTDDEMALGVEGWRLLPDPFGPWHEEAAA